MPRLTTWIRRATAVALLATGAAWAEVPPGDMPEPPPHRDGDRREVDRDAVMKWVKANHPELAERMVKLRESDPEAARRAMAEAMRKYRDAHGMDRPVRRPAAGDERPADDDRRPGNRGDREHDFGRILERLRESDPERYEELSRLREEDPQAFRRVMKEWFQQNYPEYQRQVFGAEKRSQKAAADYHKAATAEEKAALEAELQASVEAAFDERLEIQQQRISQMEQQLAVLKQQLAERAEKKQEIVDARVQQLKENPPAARDKGDAGRPPRDKDRP